MEVIRPTLQTGTPRPRENLTTLMAHFPDTPEAGWEWHEFYVASIQKRKKKKSELSLQVGGDGMALQTASGLLLLAFSSRSSLWRLGSGSWCSRHFLSGCDLEQMLPQEQLEALSQNGRVGGTAWAGRCRGHSPPPGPGSLQGGHLPYTLSLASDALLSLQNTHGPLDCRANLRVSIPSEGLDRRSPLPSHEESIALLT